MYSAVWTIVSIYCRKVHFIFNKIQAQFDCSDLSNPDGLLEDQN
jgi:hypothetical protein